MKSFLGLYLTGHAHFSLGDWRADSSISMVCEIILGHQLPSVSYGMYPAETRHNAVADCLGSPSFSRKRATRRTLSLLLPGTVPEPPSASRSGSRDFTSCCFCPATLRNRWNPLSSLSLSSDLLRRYVEARYYPKVILLHHLLYRDHQGLQQSMSRPPDVDPPQIAQRPPSALGPSRLLQHRQFTVTCLRTAKGRAYETCAGRFCSVSGGVQWDL